MIKHKSLLNAQQRYQRVLDRVNDVYLRRCVAVEAFGHTNKLNTLVTKEIQDSLVP